MHRLNRIAILGTGLLGLAVASSSAVQAAKFASYDITHAMTITPKKNSVWDEVAWNYSTTAHAFNTVPEDAHVVKQSFLNFDHVAVASATSDAIVSDAIARAFASVDGIFVDGQAATASVHVDGYATVYPVPPPEVNGAAAISHASAFLQAIATHTSSDGWIDWSSNSQLGAWGDAVVGEGHTQGIVKQRQDRLVDPIKFVATNLDTNEVRAGTLLEIDASIGYGTLGWSGGILTIGSGVGFFYIDIPGVYTREQGTVDLEFFNGVFTRAIGTGIFAGKVPLLGSAALGSYDLGETRLNYDFGFGDDDVRADFDFSHGGGVFVHAALVPEPASWAMMIAGFGLIGTALRRRQQHGAAARG